MTTPHEKNPADLRPQLRLAHHIAETRRARGIKQEVMAERLEMCPTNLSRIENGFIGINTDMLTKIAQALETTPSRLLSEAGL